MHGEKLALGGPEKLAKPLWRNAFAAMQPSETAFQVGGQLALLCAA